MVQAPPIQAPPLAAAPSSHRRCFQAGRLSLSLLLLLLGFCAADPPNPYEPDAFKYYCETAGIGTYMRNAQHTPGRRNAVSGENEPTKCTFDIIPDKRSNDDPHEMCEEALPYVITETKVTGNTVSCTAIETQTCPDAISIGDTCFEYETTPTTFAIAETASVIDKYNRYFRRWLTTMGDQYMQISWMAVDNATPRDLNVKVKLEVRYGAHYFVWLTAEESTRENLPFALLLYQPTDMHVRVGDLVAVVDTDIKLPYFKHMGGVQTDYMPKFLCDKMGNAMGMQTFYFEDASTRNGKSVDEWGNEIRPKCFFVTSNNHYVKTIDGEGMQTLHEHCPTVLEMKSEPAVFYDPYIMKQVSSGFVAKAQDKQAPLAVRLAAAHVYAKEAWKPSQACKKCTVDNGYCENRSETMLWFFYGPDGKPMLHVHGGLWAHTREAAGGKDFVEVVYPIEQCSDTPHMTAVLDMRLGGLVNLGPERRLPILCVAETHSSYQTGRVAKIPEYSSHVSYMNRHNLQKACAGLKGRTKMFLGTSCVVQSSLSRETVNKGDHAAYDAYRHDLQRMSKEACTDLTGYKVNLFEPTHEEKCLRLINAGFYGIIAAIRNPIVAFIPGHPNEGDNVYKNAKEKKDSHGRDKTYKELRKDFKYLDEFGRATESSFENDNLWYGNQPNENPYRRENCVKMLGTQKLHDFSCIDPQYLCEYKNDLVPDSYRKNVKLVDPP